ncbi:MAG: PP2C family protein-serine/threonine phosphatase [Candidatus Baltobacteraceae bacterium]
MPDYAESALTRLEGIETKPAAATRRHKRGSATVVLKKSGAYDATTEEAAQVLVHHLFAQNDIAIPGISYGVGYKLATGTTGGDIVDIYHYDNDAVAVAIADVAGKGPKAAVQAAMIKYALRAYSSAGMTPERVVRALDRLYLENNAFEKLESFASVFFGSVDPTRRLMHYTCAGHEPVFLISPEGRPIALMPTAPLIGIFDDQHHLFKQAFVEITPGTIFLGATDGITEARDAEGRLYGMERLIAMATDHRHEPEAAIVQAIFRDVDDFCIGNRRDDIALVAVRFL